MRDADRQAVLSGCCRSRFRWSIESCLSRHRSEGRAGRAAGRGESGRGGRGLHCTGTTKDAAVGLLVSGSGGAPRPRPSAKTSGSNRDTTTCDVPRRGEEMTTPPANTSRASCSCRVLLDEWQPSRHHVAEASNCVLQSVSNSGQPCYVCMSVYECV